MNKVDCYYYDEESDCCGALSDYSKMPCGLVPCTDDKCGMKKPRQSFQCTGKNCPMGFNANWCTLHDCEHRTVPKPTNFDKITSSVEILADYLIETVDLDFGGRMHKSADGKFCETYEEARQRTIEWLEQEVE